MKVDNKEAPKPDVAPPAQKESTKAVPKDATSVKGRSTSNKSKSNKEKEVAPEKAEKPSKITAKVAAVEKEKPPVVEKVAPKQPQKVSNKTK